MEINDLARLGTKVMLRGVVALLAGMFLSLVDDYDGGLVGLLGKAALLLGGAATVTGILVVIWSLP